MKVKFRTILLVFIFIKLCILFTVLQESIESLASDDHPLLLGTRDIYLFDLMLSIVCAVSMSVSLVLIVLFAIGHCRLRKPYTIFAFSINLIFVAPFFYSGLYLSFNSHTGLELSSKVRASFQKMFEFADDFNFNFNSNSTDGDDDDVFNRTTSPTPVVDTSLLADFQRVEHIQKRYCCCGLDGGQYYGFDNVSTALHERIPFTSKLDIRCPRHSLFKNSTCGDSHLRGCESRVTRVHPTRVLLYSCIGAVLSTLFAVASPFVYSQFEVDRRRARAQFIRNWRRAVELHVTEHRMSALRQGGGSPTSEQDAEPLLQNHEPNEDDVDGVVNENRSAPRF